MGGGFVTNGFHPACTFRADGAFGGGEKSGKAVSAIGVSIAPGKWVSAMRSGVQSLLTASSCGNIETVGLGDGNAVTRASSSVGDNV